MRKKLLIILVVLIAILAVRDFGTLAYKIHTAKVMVGVTVGGKWERIGMTLSGLAPQKIENQFIEVHAWNDLVITELSREVQEPCDIRVSGEVKDGKTTLCYEGTYTTKDGETVEYFEEKTFDFVMDLDKQLLED